MKVKDMLEILSTLNPNAEVIIQKDSEGNRYSPLKGIYTEKVYVPGVSNVCVCPHPTSQNNISITRKNPAKKLFFLLFDGLNKEIEIKLRRCDAEENRASCFLLIKKECCNSINSIPQTSLFQTH